MAITLDGANGITTPDLDSSGPITGTTGIFSGAVQASGVTTNLYPLVSGTSVASTSGTSIDFTGIPSWVKRITVIFEGVSTDSSSNLVVQIGDSGGIETTGYVSGAANASTSVTIGTTTTSFVIDIAVATSSTDSGLLVLTNISGNTWVSSGVLNNVSNGVAKLSAGAKTLSDTLTQLRFTTAGGTATFDAGSVNIFYE